MIQKTTQQPGNAFINSSTTQQRNNTVDNNKSATRTDSFVSRTAMGLSPSTRKTNRAPIA
ncbi:hypothetical protein L195_g039386, partial [Trifolium pratense]